MSIQYHKMYSHYLTNDNDFCGSWIDFVSSYTAHKRVNPIGQDTFTVSVDSQNSMLELYIKLGLEGSYENPDKSNYFMIADILADFFFTNPESEPKYIVSGEAAKSIEIGRRYWYKPNTKSVVYREGPVIVAAITGATAWVYDDKPISYRTNRRGRRVVDFDPSTIRSPADMTELYSYECVGSKADTIRRSMFPSSAPCLSQLMYGFSGPSNTVDPALLSYKAQPEEKLKIISGHLSGWRDRGVSESEIKLMTEWMIRNMMIDVDLYHDAAPYTPEPIFSSFGISDFYGKKKGKSKVYN